MRRFERLNHCLTPVFPLTMLLQRGSAPAATEFWEPDVKAKVLHVHIISKSRFRNTTNQSYFSPLLKRLNPTRMAAPRAAGRASLGPTDGDMRHAMRELEALSARDPRGPHACERSEWPCARVRPQLQLCRIVKN